MVKEGMAKREHGGNLDDDANSSDDGNTDIIVLSSNQIVVDADTEAAASSPNQRNNAEASIGHGHDHVGSTSEPAFDPEHGGAPQPTPIVPAQRVSMERVDDRNAGRRGVARRPSADDGLSLGLGRGEAGAVDGGDLDDEVVQPVFLDVCHDSRFSASARA